MSDVCSCVYTQYMFIYPIHCRLLGLHELILETLEVWSYTFILKLLLWLYMKMQKVTKLIQDILVSLARQTFPSSS